MHAHAAIDIDGRLPPPSGVARMRSGLPRRRQPLDVNPVRLPQVSKHLARDSGEEAGDVRRGRSSAVRRCGMGRK